MPTEPVKTDFGKTHRVRLAAVGAPALDITVTFADEASKVFCAYRDQYEFGASDMEPSCGNIYDSEGSLVGRISYNGRIWDGQNNPVE
jgi:hypothetical protein